MLNSDRSVVKRKGVSTPNQVTTRVLGPENEVSTCVRSLTTLISFKKSNNNRGLPFTSQNFT